MYTSYMLRIARTNFFSKQKTAYKTKNITTFLEASILRFTLKPYFRMKPREAAPKKRNQEQIVQRKAFSASEGPHISATSVDTST